LKLPSRSRRQLQADRTSPQQSAAAEARAAQIPQEQTAKTLVLHIPPATGSPSSLRSSGGPAGRARRRDREPPTGSTCTSRPNALEMGRHDVRFAAEADMAADFSHYEVGAIPPIGPHTPWN
jgi:prolyl-tRNA editing enzyme YbaK/EbsC (Cys-tRNA(Pro) deacylase)